jgi:DNA excision repair protein ERCC-4
MASQSGGQREVSTLYLPADPSPAQFTVLIEDREQLPFDFEPFGMRSERCHLTTGDYTIRGCENSIAIERKSPEDLAGSCGCGRDPFQREMDRLRAFPTRAVVVECSWADLERGEWRSKIKPASVVASVLGWIADGIPFVMAGNRAKAAEYTTKILLLAARRRYRECRSLALSSSATEGNAT